MSKTSFSISQSNWAVGQNAIPPVIKKVTPPDVSEMDDTEAKAALAKHNQAQVVRRHDGGITMQVTRSAPQDSF